MASILLYNENKEKQSLKGTVFSIEEFATFDGPGIRMTVFMKGCPLSCSWCHNPEGQSVEVEFVRSPNGCIGCGECERAGEIRNGRPRLTERSVAACSRNLVRRCGDEYSVDELTALIMKNARVLSLNGGGVTFSGGEPLLSHEFVFACMDNLRGRVHCALQTCGFTTTEVFDSALRKADYFLYDLKVMDGAASKRYCGVDNAVILRNYRELAKSGKPFVTRVPLIPGVTDTEENLRSIAKFLKENGVNYVEVLPYNKLAGSKYAMTLREYKPDFDDKKEVNLGVEIFEKYGISVKKM